ncbi:hypothetical protein Pcinc_023025 [Petrolisthes cinctipes]|uniref:Uncharacterized protein n=1 Tax=Petrolisthes cinctipes TaxID=88211 RepID=A0AAE1KFW7_PETCI|nr:hypothetical protein Pcinc_023025 [Petrolisthes cinctipes]
MMASPLTRILLISLPLHLLLPFPHYPAAYQVKAEAHMTRHAKPSRTGCCRLSEFESNASQSAGSTPAASGGGKGGGLEEENDGEGELRERWLTDGLGIRVGEKHGEKQDGVGEWKKRGEGDGWAGG